MFLTFCVFEENSLRFKLKTITFTYAMKKILYDKNYNNNKWRTNKKLSFCECNDIYYAMTFRCKWLKFGVRLMNSESHSASELRIQQVHIKSDSESNEQNFCCISTANILRQL